MAIMNRKEMQYRIAITSNAFSSFEFNLTQDLIEQDIIRENAAGEQISLLARAGLQAPCKASECFESWKQFILPESLADYSDVVNVENLRQFALKREKWKLMWITGLWWRMMSVRYACARPLS